MTIPADPATRTTTPVQATPAALAKYATMMRRNTDLVTANKALIRELKHRDAVQARLIRSECRCQALLTASHRLQDRLRGMSRRMLVAQEEDRKRISRELHDVVLQTLTGITVLLEPLKTQARHHASSLERTVRRTQRLVAQSVAIVHRFARDLRPAALDDLGLIPALESFTRDFGLRTGLQMELTLSAEVEALPMTARTVLFRVAQEALLNTARHAQATTIDVTLERVGDDYCLRIHDDGRSFQAQDPLLEGDRKGLGLLSMHERMSLAGGRLEVVSQRGQGTTISAWLPGTKRTRPRRLPTVSS